MKKIIFTITLLCFIILNVAAQENIRLQFNKDGKFKIVQFTDLHWQHGSPNSAKTVATIRAVLEAEKPDLAILTGDIVCRWPAREPWTDIPRIFEDAKTPFAAVLGNHDSESATQISREEIFDLLSRSPYFVGEKGPADIHGWGNYVLPVQSSKTGKVSALLYCLDSNDYSSDPRYGTYDPIYFNQIDWYRQQSSKFTHENGNKPLPALAFFHIPLLEYNDVIGKNNTIGHLGEHVASPNYNTGMFGAILEKGDVKGVFVGHDHENDYIGIEKGIALAYGRVSGADQGSKLEQGGRVIELYEDKFAFDTWIRTPRIKELEFHYPQQLTDFVDPFVGTAYVGHTHPSASLPFSMVQVGPDTGTEGWEHCAGYRDTDRSVMGFSHTHLSGTGAAEMGDIMIMPVTGDIKFDAGTLENPDAGYRSRFSQENEVAKPGYYKTLLDDYGITAEMTLTPRVGFHQYTFSAADKAGVLFDMEHGIGDKTYSSAIRVINDSTVVGFRKSNGFTSDHGYYFAARFSKPAGKTTAWKDGAVSESRTVEGVNTKMHIAFAAAANEVLKVKIALSTTGEDGALKNLEAELPGWDFDAAKKQANDTWNQYLSKIEVNAIDDDQKKSYYTSLYHALLMPNLVTDTDGKYYGWDKKIHQSTSGDMYTNFSLWDTYRALHPFLSIMYPEINSQLIKSMLERHRQVGLLPTNEYGLCETWCMIGNHAIPVIVDAYLKGDKSFDAALAYKAIKHAQTAEHQKADWGNYNKYGYFPFDKSSVESVSRTLESGYDDYCVALMAKALGKNDDYKYFMNRAGFYKNLYDPSVMLVRGRDSQGNWRTPFHSFALTSESEGGDYTEGNAWQWTWHIQHDIPGLIKLFGSKEAFVTKLDSLFFVDVKELPGIVEVPDVTGLIGLYAQGNEPSHHIAYIYRYADRPDRTAEIVRTIFDQFYLPTRDGLCGNDDCGQMSAWYLFSAMGFYPVDPASQEYVLGAPQINSVSLKLPNGKVFEVKAKDLSKANKYVKTIKLNGQLVTQPTISYDDIKNGGLLEFEMTNKKQE